MNIWHKFTASPGEIIGEVSSADIPTSEGTGKKSNRLISTPTQIVLDTVGGQQPLPSGFAGGSIDRPALTLLLRPDGSVMARSEPEDFSNDIRKDIKRNYTREIRSSNKKRKSSMGSGYGSMMGYMAA